MARHLTTGLVLGCSMFLLLGCRSTTEQPGEAPPQPKAPARAETSTITLHVKDMAERLDLT